MGAIIACISAVIAGVLFVAWQAVKKSKAPAEKEKAEQKKDSPDDSAKPAPDPTKPKPPPTPAPAVSARSWGWVWRLIIIIAVVLFIGRWVWNETGVKSTYSPPQATAPRFQQFPIAIDPLSYNRTKSKKVLAGTGIDGNMTIIVDPGGEIVYDVNITGEIPPANNPFLKLDLFLWPSKTQSMGYRVNDIRHDNIRVGQFGRETFIPQPREFRLGVNEIAFFAEGELKIDGDRKITVTR